MLDIDIWKEQIGEIYKERKGKFRVGIKNFLEEQNSKPIFLQPEWNNKDKILPFIMKTIHSNSHLKITTQLHKYLNIG